MNIYADGFGRWHVILPDTRLALRWAVRAIAEELFCRSNGEQTKEELALYVERNIVSIPDGVEPGFVHFAEYALES